MDFLFPPLNEDIALSPIHDQELEIMDITAKSSPLNEDIALIPIPDHVLDIIYGYNCKKYSGCRVSC